MEDKTFIFGHKNPDTDSVASAICLSYLYNELGENTEPRILSNINEETKYVLKRFKFETPKLLNDVKLQIKDINYHKDFKININESVYRAFFKMQDNNMSSIPLVDDNDKFMGTFAMKDIAKREILGDIRRLTASYDHILEVINGKKILRFNDEIDGDVFNVAIKSTTFNESFHLTNKTILILGDRHSIIEEAVKKGVLMLIITAGREIKKEHLEIAKKNKVNVIYTDFDSMTTLIKIGFARHIKDYQYTTNLVCTNNEMEVSELNEIINKTKHSYYPVLDNYNKCLGLIKLADLPDKNPKKIILVDHNEVSQSVYGIEEASIVGIVDHHKLGTLGTMEPINFRNMTVGSTCTIVYELFKENKVKIPENIAGLLLSGLISDTLLLKSPTTTKIDEKVFNDLSKMVNIDINKFAMEMFKANDIVKSKTIKEILYTDFKTFDVNGKIVGVGQVNTLNSKAIIKQKTSYIRYLNKESELHNYDILMLCITDIFKNGSYLLFNSKSIKNIQNAFGDNINEGDFIQDIISRKKQIIPAIMNSIK